MRILIDTHILLWWDANPEKLSASAHLHLNNPFNTLFISVASVWEMQIKIAGGKLATRLPLADLIRGQTEENGFQILPVTLSHAMKLENLPLHHRDPFDRLLIAQAQEEGLMLLTADAVFRQYEVDSLS